MTLTGKYETILAVSILIGIMYCLLHFIGFFVKLEENEIVISNNVKLDDWADENVDSMAVQYTHVAIPGFRTVVDRIVVISLC